MRFISKTPVLYHGSLTDFHGAAFALNMDPVYPGRWHLITACGENLRNVRRESFTVLPAVA